MKRRRRRELELLIGGFDEFPFPLGHHHGRQTVADHVGHRARHVHQLVNAQNERHAFQRQSIAGERAGEDHERCPRNSSDALAREHQRDQHGDLVTDREMHTCRLRHEDSRERKIQRGPVQVEAVPEGKDERYDSARHAELLEDLHGPRQRRFARRR